MSTTATIKEEAINEMIKNCDSHLISDGYHTFGELYEHRHVLFICLAKILTDRSSNFIWKSKLHSDGNFIEGYFMMGINATIGHQISYHIPLSYWEATEFASKLERAPAFDGHTSTEVIDRQMNLVLNK